MLDNYKKLITDSIDITKDFDINVISIENVFYKSILSEGENTAIYNTLFNIINNYLCYSFIYNDSYNIIAIKSSTISINDYLDYSFHIDSNDIFHIKVAEDYKVYQFDLNWFDNEENLDEMCEMEMDKIRPLIRRRKINNLLNG